MFISRPSDPRTVLLWGDRWWLPGTGEAVAFPNVVEAAEALAEHFATEPKPIRLRLIYQPDGFTSVAAACPPGGRQILSAALAAEFPMLANPGHAWSHEPVLPVGTEHSTILHFETEPVLIALATRLAHLGLAVDSAWPLATYLHALPDDWTETGAITIVAIQSGRATAYRQPRDAARFVQSWHGESALAEVAKWLGSVQQEDPAEQVLIVGPDPEITGKLESYRSTEHAALEFIRVTEALGRPVVIPRYHPAQLLPRGPTFTAQQMAMAASLALVCAAGWLGFAYIRDTISARAETRTQAAQIATLRSDVAHLRANAAEIRRLRNAIEGGLAGAPFDAILQRLAATLPPEIALSTLRLSGRTMEFGGWVSPTAAVATLDLWRDRFSPAKGPWTATLHPGAGGAFTLNGEVRP